MQKDDGFDPADVDYTEPQFSSSPLREGAQLVGHTVGLREMVWPLKLSAVSKDALHATVAELNREHRPGETRVEWRDKGATVSTFFDAEDARFEPDFNYWRGQANRMHGVLRVWVQPYGHTGAERLISSGVSTRGPGDIGNHVAVATIPPGTIAGDVPALMRAQAKSTLYETRDMAFAVLPPGYTSQIGAAALFPTNGAILVESQPEAALGRWLQREVSAYATMCQIPVSAAHVGRNRIICFCNTAHAAGRNVTLQLRDAKTNAIVLASGTVIAGLSGWQAIDLGVISITPDLIASLPRINVAAFTPITGVAATVWITDFVLLPEHSTHITSWRANPGTAAKTAIADGIRERSRWSDATGAFEYDATGDSRGAIPKLPPDAGGVVALAMDAPNTRRGDDTLTVEVWAREQFKFAR
jgi:hypothetical protein